MKATVHAALAAAAGAEAVTAKTRARKLLLGLAVGWHLHATLYHLFLEK